MKVRTEKRTGIRVLVAAAVVALTMALSAGVAFADEDGTSGVLTGGDLSISNALEGGTFAGTLTGAAATLNANVAGGGTEFSGFQITDARGTGVGWQVTMVATQFDNATQAGKDLALNSLTMPLLAVAKNDAGSSALPGTLHAATTIDTGDAGVVMAACSAFGQGMGTYDFTAAESAPWQLAVTADEFSGTYNSTITTTLATLAISE
jgi:hypothetical protein